MAPSSVRATRVAGPGGTGAYRDAERAGALTIHVRQAPLGVAVFVFLPGAVLSLSAAFVASFLAGKVIAGTIGALFAFAALDYAFSTARIDVGAQVRVRVRSLRPRGSVWAELDANELATLVVTEIPRKWAGRDGRNYRVAAVLPDGTKRTVVETADEDAAEYVAHLLRLELETRS